MKKINNYITKNIINIIIIFLYIQPVLDVITAISINYFNIELTIGSILRLLFLTFCIYYLLFINKNRNKYNISYLIINLIYILIFGIYIYIKKDLSTFVYEIKNILNTFYLPISILTLYNIFKEEKNTIKMKHLINIYCIYIILVFIPSIFNIGFKSYSHSKEGNIGFFISANAVGNTLSLLLPFVIYYLFNLKNKYTIKLLITVGTLYVFLSMGTKVPVLSIILISILILIYYFIKWIKNKEYNKYIATIGVIVIIGISSLLIIPKTSFYKNLEIHRKYLGFDHYYEVVTNYNLLDKFVFSERLTFLKHTYSNYKSSNIFEKLIGIGYVEKYNTIKENRKTIEIDYFDVLYRHGIIGTIIFFSIFIYIISINIKYIFNKLDTKKYAYFISILIILLLSLFSGHILITPCVSIYVALVLTTIKNKLNTN